MDFDHIAGNQKVKRMLATYIRRGLIPASMIFSGHDSANTLPMALAVAQAMNCLTPEAEGICSCANCRAIERGIFPDVRLVVPDGQFFRKAQIDELIEDARFKPALAQKKIFILHHAHRLNESSANAFLKTLEEPTPSNMFLLVTSNLNLILPTIRSRCQVIPFFPLTRLEIELELVKGGIEKEKARLLSFYPHLLLDQFSQKDWQEMESKRTAQFALLACLLTQSSVEDILLDLYDRSRSREHFLLYFKELIHTFLVFLRDLMILQVDRQTPYLANDDLRPSLLALIPSLHGTKVLSLIQRMEWLLRDVQRNLNTRVLILEFINGFSPEAG